VHLERGRLPDAAKDLVRFDELRARAPKDISPKDQALAWYVRSQLARSAGQEEEAAAAYKTAVELDPTNPDFPFGLGRWLLDAERPEEALRHLQKAAALEPDRYGVLVELAEAEMAVEDFDDARAHIDRALEKNEDFVPALIARARLMQRTRERGVEAFLQQVLQEHPTAKVDVQLELGRHHRARGALSEAQAALEAAVQSMGGAGKTKQGRVYLEYGQIMEERGQLGIAENAYEQAGERGQVEGWFRLALVAKKAGDRRQFANGCRRYLQAGVNLPFSERARDLCGVQ